MSLDWYPWYVRDFRRDTLHLTLAQEGAYRRLIDEYMVTEGPLPDNDAAVARIAGVTVEEWLAVAAVVREFFKPSNGKLIHKRCEDELHAQRMRSARRSQSASHAANSRHQRDRENKAVISVRMPGAYGAHADAMRNDATLQRKKEREGSTASLATALPTGALRSPSRSIEPSPELINLVATKVGR